MTQPRGDPDAGNHVDRPEIAYSEADRSPDESRREAMEWHRQELRLQSIRMIEQAKGVLMGHYRIDADAAFVRLSHWSQHHNLKTRLLSEAIVQLASEPPQPLPHTPPGADPLIRFLACLDAARSRGRAQIFDGLGRVDGLAQAAFDLDGVGRPSMREGSA